MSDNARIVREALDRIAQKAEFGPDYIKDREADKYQATFRVGLALEALAALTSLETELSDLKAELARAREEERERGERIIALMIFLRWWDEDPRDMTDERIAEMVAKFDRDFLPSLNEPHCGDCTKVPMPCTRCHTEELLSDAKRIRAALAPEQKENS